MYFKCRDNSEMNDYELGVTGVEELMREQELMSKIMESTNQKRGE